MARMSTKEYTNRLCSVCSQAHKDDENEILLTTGGTMVKNDILSYTSRTVLLTIVRI